MISATVSAETPEIVVTSSDGSTTSLVLEEGMSGTYYSPKSESATVNLQIIKGDFTYDENGNRIPDTSSGNPGKVFFDMSVNTISAIDFMGTVAAVSEIVDDNNLAIYLADAILKFSGVKSPVEIIVCSADGVTELHRTVTVDTEINLREYGSGLHIVKAGSRSFKILVK